MFEKPWNSVKRMLLAGLCLTTLFAPYESEAAPKKETKKERRERLKREEERRKKRQKTPPKKKITPTFEEKLTPAQVEQKIRTIRKRIETAPESTIPAKYKCVLFEVFDDMVQTPMGRYIFEKAHPDLSFCVKKIERTTNGTYGHDSRCISLNNNIFEQNINAKTPAEKLYEKLYLAHVIAHEATHSIQHVNNMNRFSNMSFEERITIHKLFELNSILNQNLVRYHVAELAQHQALTRSNEQIFVPMHRFYRDLFKAYKTTGLTEEKAHRAARTKFVETFWRNKGATPIQIGEKTITPCDEVIQNWHASYNYVATRRLVTNNTPYREAMRDRGIEPNLRVFTKIMQIDTQPSFFRDPKTTAFDMPSSRRLVAYANGIRDAEIDILKAGTIIKGYKNGELYFIVIETSHPKIAAQNASHTDYHEGTNIKKATYTYRNGKMNGIYREYDRQGNQIMEVPVENDNVKGDGWITENGKRVLKTFYAYNYLKNRKQ